MTKKKNGKEDFLKWLGALAGLGSIGYLILSILTSSVTEAQKYFAVTILIFIILILYIELVVKKSVKR